MNKLQRRLKAVELAVPELQPASLWSGLAYYLVTRELARLHGIVQRAVKDGGGRPVNANDDAQYRHLLGIALERKQSGWEINGREMRKMDAEDRGKLDPVWRFIFALRGRHAGRSFTELSDPRYFDVVDVDAHEIDTLANLIRRATCAADTQAFASVINRLCIVGRFVEIKEFDGLVFKGDLPQGQAAG